MASVSSVRVLLLPPLMAERVEPCEEERKREVSRRSGYESGPALLHRFPSSCETHCDTSQVAEHPGEGVVLPLEDDLGARVDGGGRHQGGRGEKEQGGESSKHGGWNEGVGKGAGAG